MHSPSLPELQAWMHQTICDPNGAASATQGQSLSWLRNPPSGDIHQRLDIYAEGYFLNTAGILEELLPHTYRIVEAQQAGYFKTLVADFLCTYGSSSPNAHSLGAEFLVYIQGEFPQTWIAELVELEWRIVKVTFSAPSPECGKLTANSSLELLSNNWEISSLLEGANEPPVGREYLTIYRSSDESVIRTALIAPQFKLLEGLLTHGDLGLACQHLAEQCPDFESPNLVTQWVTDWLSCGILTQ